MHRPASLVLLVALLSALSCVDHTLQAAKRPGAASRAASGPSSRPTSRPAPRNTSAKSESASERNKRLLEAHGGEGAKKIKKAREALPKWDAFGRVLGLAVRGKLVDYKVVRRERAVLEAVLAEVAKADFSGVDKVAQLSAIINTYNAATLLLVLDHVLGKGADGEDLVGVLEVEKSGGIRFFDSKQVVFAGESLSLNELEAKGRALGDPRIHFAVNCASISCPPLLGRAWSAESLERDLAAATRAYVASPEGLQVRDRQAFASKIFEWYAKDWGGADGVKNFLMLYAPAAAKEVLHTELGFLEYDWRLNAAR